MFQFFVLFNLIILFPIVIYGIIISFVNKKNSENLQTPSKWWIYTLFGFIGTPIHEISHLIFNLIFFHKVKKVVLYRPREGRKDGTLGYVNFTYNEKSIYQNIGLFFTGIAPMIGGCAVVFLLEKLLLPEVFNNFEYIKIGSLNIIDILNNLKDGMIANIKCLFQNYSSLQNLIIFLALTFAISTHMSISIPDLKLAKKGWIMLEIIVLIISILMGCYNLTIYSNFLFYISSFMISFFTIGLIFSFIALGISYLIKLI